ncbi:MULTISPECIES: transglutaminase-like cysteine peptidase [unclassified Halomonas]|uniref:transglutaminase-like cysteine peptidase n=1 Tax=unclassified Halomonas TaxID=2609666 RepID=UPI0007F0E146|nr:MULTISPECIES: transglutaminase-like cysteine peptidase [unclassified Halomonas]SBR50298.1 transglutaminase-like cysteine proteinase BTLCP [Halomonas sp. HL-93]SNY96776.1 transglutaminase-like cysteine proteinase BTLCP [Halomonas sp. hl-4]
MRVTRRQLLAGLGAGMLCLFIGAPSPASAFNPERVREKMRQAHGDSGVALIDDWLAMIERLRDARLGDQLREVNDFFNRKVRWRDDIDIWGQEDYWATPLEMLGKREGDCEDYSIAKYITLKELGVPGNKLRMIYVRARIGRSQRTQAHMVLGYYQTSASEPLLLDNIIPSIRPASERDDLDPVFSFNSSGLWAGGSRESRADPLARLSRWQSVVDRMRDQGFI